MRVGSSTESLTRGSVILTSTRLVVVLVAYLLNVFLARQLGPEQYGLLGVVVTVLVWLELVVAEGLPLYIARTGGFSGGEETAISRRYLVAQIALSLAMAALLFVLAPLLARLFEAPESLVLFRFASLDIPLFGIYSLFSAVLLGAQLFGPYGFSEVAYSFAKLGATLFFTLVMGLAALGAVLGSVSASAAGILVAGLLVAWGYARHRIAEKDEPTHFDQEAVEGEALAGSVISVAFVLLYALLTSMGLWVLRAMDPGGAAGLYRAASLIALVPIEISAGLAVPLYAAYSNAYRREDAVRCTHYITQAVRLLLVAGVLWVALIAPTAEQLMGFVFSKTYADGGTLLAILVVGLTIGMFGDALAPLLLVRGKGKQLIGAVAVLLAILLGLSTVLIPRFDALGAGVASGGVLAAGGVAVLVYLRGELASGFLGQAARVLLAGAVVALLAWLAPVTASVTLLVWYVALAALYAALLWILRVVTPRDLRALYEGVVRG
jgi:stage V sporulation protein B